VLVFRDISERKRVQVELRESEGRFRGLMEQAPFSIQVFSPDGRTLRVNKAWEELW
jgi:PAS domain-containing protein